MSDTPGPSDRELLRLLISEAVRDGFDTHRERDHKPLEEKLDQTRRQVWMGAGITLAFSTMLGKLFR